MCKGEAVITRSWMTESLKDKLSFMLNCKYEWPYILTFWIPTMSKYVKNHKSFISVFLIHFYTKTSNIFGTRWKMGSGFTIFLETQI